jgi:serine/threonine protein phosphatase 1
LRSFAIGDVHGCVRTLTSLIEDHIRPKRGETLYFLGDYINKGPDSRGVLDYIFHLRSTGLIVKCLRGNHEQYLLDALVYKWEEISFLSRGGEATLRSFNVEDVRDIPSGYLDFIRGLPYYFETKEYLIIHAGLNFDLTDPFKDDYSMLNIKDMDPRPEAIGGRTILHGHVPTPLASIISMASDPHTPEICLDGGCVYIQREGSSYLVGMDLGDRRLYYVENRDGFTPI